MVRSYSLRATARRAKARKEQQRRTGYVRPSRAKPRPGWTLNQLAEITGTRRDVLKRWLATGVVPRPPFHGAATRYERQQLVWVLAVRRLQVTDQVPLPKIKQRLIAMSGEQVEALAREACPPGAAAEALGIATPEAASGVEALAREACPPGAAAEALGIATPEAATGMAISTSIATSDLPAAGPGVGRWTRFDLGLGLELGVRDDASPAIRALAARIRDMCAAGS